MTDDRDSMIRDRIKEIFPDEGTAKIIVDLACRRKPPNYSRRSNLPYYKETYARQLQKFIDQMIIDRQPILYRYATWCNSQSGMSETTLYQRINQSIRYLVDKLDVDGQYLKWSELCKVRRVRNLGVKLEFNEAAVNAGGQEFAPEVISPNPEKDKKVWQSQLDEWLESEETRPFIKENLLLTKDDVRDLKIQLAQVKNVQFSIDFKSIKIIKLAF